MVRSATQTAHRDGCFRCPDSPGFLSHFFKMNKSFVIAAMVAAVALAACGKKEEAAVEAPAPVAAPAAPAADAAPAAAPAAAAPAAAPADAAAAPAAAPAAEEKKQ